MRSLFRCEARFHGADDVLLSWRRDGLAAKTGENLVRFCRCLDEPIHDVAWVEAHVQQCFCLLKELAAESDDQTAAVANLCGSAGSAKLKEQDTLGTQLVSESPHLCPLAVGTERQNFCCACATRESDACKAGSRASQLTGRVLHLQLGDYRAGVARHEKSLQVVDDHFVHAVRSHGSTDHHRELLACFDLREFSMSFR